MPTFCSFCKENVEAEVDEANGFTCCTSCGRVLDDSVFSSDPTFLKTPSGASQVEGNFVPESGITASLTRGPRGSVTLGFQSQDSHEKTLNRGRLEINELADRLSIRPREDIAAAAHRLYRLAVQRNFTRGRRTQQVAAACLYTICRQERKPYMLIDFSDCIQTNVYMLGAVFLQLIHLLRLESHPIISRPIDPSLYIHRFADRMGFGKSMHTVANTALRLVSSMKRDWMQTGRRPAGICGAALFLASHMHNFPRKKSDIVSVVHVCEATINLRLGEFNETPNADLTVVEFEKWSQEHDQRQLALPGPAAGTSGAIQPAEAGEGRQDFLVAVNGVRHSVAEIVKLCGGFEGGQDPPSFKKGLAAQQAAEAAGAGEELSIVASAMQREVDTANETAAGPTEEKEPEIDDDEIDTYLHTSDEIEFKEMLWRQMNQDYLSSQPQQEPDAAAQATPAAIEAPPGRGKRTAASRGAAAKASGSAAREAADDAEEEGDAAAPSAAEDAAGPSSRDGKCKGGRKAKAGGAGAGTGAGGDATRDAGGPARVETASEAAHRVLTSKRLSSKVNYSALQELFDEGPAGGAEASAGGEAASGDAPADKDAASADPADNDDSRLLNGKIGCGIGLGISLGDALRARKKVRFA